MDIIRRNTDYALRLMVNLGRRNGGGAVSSRVLAGEEDVPYQLTCKLLQKLHAAGLVRSRMGSKGGFCLGRGLGEITLARMVEVIQGPVSVNGCLTGARACSRQCTCPVCAKLGELQAHIEAFFSGVTLEQLLVSNKSEKPGREPERG